MGLTGFAARASGVKHDLRVDYPVPPYRQLDPRIASHTRGDVPRAFRVRFDEVVESIRLVQALGEAAAARRVRRAAREGQARCARSRLGRRLARGNPRRAGDR